MYYCKFIKNGEEILRTQTFKTVEGLQTAINSVLDYNELDAEIILNIYDDESYSKNEIGYFQLFFYGLVAVHRNKYGDEELLEEGEVKMDNTKVKNAFRWLIDDYRGMYGEKHAIAFLIDEHDFTKQELLELNFEEKDIDDVIADPSRVENEDI